MPPAAKGLAVSFSNTSMAILYLKKAIITVKEELKYVYEPDKPVCVHTHFRCL